MVLFNTQRQRVTLNCFRAKKEAHETTHHIDFPVRIPSLITIVDLTINQATEHLVATTVTDLLRTRINQCCLLIVVE